MRTTVCKVDIDAMRRALVGLIGDDVKSVLATTLHARFDDQLDRIGQRKASWSRFVDVARECGVTFRDAADGADFTAILPERPTMTDEQRHTPGDHDDLLALAEAMLDPHAYAWCNESGIGSVEYRRRWRIVEGARAAIAKATTL